MAPDHVYSPESVAPLLDEGARRFLIEAGLPGEHMLFTATPTELRPVGDRRLLKVGQSDADDWFCVDADSGEVVSLLIKYGDIQHVNTSPETWRRSLAEFIARYPYGDRDSSSTELEDLAGHLAAALNRIDPTAAPDEEVGPDGEQVYWLDIIDDVMIGDYSGEISGG